MKSDTNEMRNRYGQLLRRNFANVRRVCVEPNKKMLIITVILEVIFSFPSNEVRNSWIECKR